MAENQNPEDLSVKELAEQIKDLASYGSFAYESYPIRIDELVNELEERAR